MNTIVSQYRRSSRLRGWLIPLVLTKLKKCLSTAEAVDLGDVEATEKVGLEQASLSTAEAVDLGDILIVIDEIKTRLCLSTAEAVDLGDL